MKGALVICMAVEILSCFFSRGLGPAMSVFKLLDLPLLSPLVVYLSDKEIRQLCIFSSLSLILATLESWVSTFTVLVAWMPGLVPAGSILVVPVFVMALSFVLGFYSLATFLLLKISVLVLVHTKLGRILAPLRARVEIKKRRGPSRISKLFSGRLAGDQNSGLH